MHQSGGIPRPIQQGIIRWCRPPTGVAATRGAHGVFQLRIVHFFMVFEHHAPRFAPYAVALLPTPPKAYDII